MAPFAKAEGRGWEASPPSLMLSPSITFKIAGGYLAARQHDIFTQGCVGVVTRDCLKGVGSNPVVIADVIAEGQV